MNLERGFRRLILILSIAVLTAGIAFGLLVDDLRTLMGFAGALVALLWLGFYAVRWIARGFTVGGRNGRQGGG